MTSTGEIEKDIYSTFAEIASTIGYSDVNGRILAALLVSGKPLSMQEVANRIGLSLSSVSVSLDLLEFLGMIKRVKRAGDRKVYIELHGSLLDGLKRAIMARLQKSVNNTLSKFEGYRSELKNGNREETERVLASLNVLEKEVKRLDGYLNLLQKVKL